jgi:RNA polymerase sigma factor (sigma-70 family)
MAAASDYEVVRESAAVPAAFGAIFDRHSRLVYRYVRRRVGLEVASDVTAEVFLRAFRDRAGFDGRDQSALPWLLGIATNLIRMHHRTEERRLRAYARATEPGADRELSAEIDERLDAQSVRAVLSDALLALPSRQREVLLLRAWADLSAAEIAVALALSPGTVRSDLHRARNFVRGRLAAYAPQMVLEKEPNA